MALFSRNERLPDALRPEVTSVVPRGDALLSQASLEDGSWIVATRAGVLRVGSEAGMKRPWTDVDRGRWDPELSTLTVQWVDGSPATTLAIAQARRTTFLRVFRERVQSSVVLSETVPLPAGSTARVAVRRSAEGELFIQVVPDPGADTRSAAAAKVIGGAVSRLSAASGAPSEGC